MAKTARSQKSTVQTAAPPAVQDKSLWYTDLSSVAPEFKNELWAAQALLYMKRSGGSRIFLDPKKAVLYRNTDSLDLDADVYKRLVDPVTPMGGGGEAKYFSSDWKSNPIYIHLKNIVKAEIQKTGKQLEVNLTDKFAKTRRMNENYRILYQNAFRKLINQLAPTIGLPGISDGQDPFKWAQNLANKTPTAEDQQKQPSDVIDKFIDLIKNQITDSQDMALYNEFIYKGDYEIAFELGIRYYIMDLNKWDERWADEFIDDILHFNKFCGEWYTDLITGRPTIERFIPEKLYTSPFKRKDGEDLMYYFIEYDVSFGDFTKTIGRNLSPQKLKEVFIWNKAQGARHNITWADAYDYSYSNLTRDNAMIRVGKAAFLSQDLSVQIEDTNSGYRMEAPNVNWRPMEDESHLNRIEKNYNVWRSWYYIPPTLSELQNSEYTWQSGFIFQLQVNQDQQRYGEDGRYSKSPLVIYDNSSQATFTDITQTFMTKINYSWQGFQNCLVNDFDAVIFSDDFVGGLLSAVDEDNKINAGDPNNPTGGNGQDAFMEQWKMIKQSGKGFLRMRDPKTGQPLMDANKLIVHIKNEYLAKAEQFLAIILQQYDLLIKSLALSPLTAGEEVKPRTPVAGLEQSLKASESATFFVQKPYEILVKMYGERMIRYILDICQEAKEGFTKRFDEFMDNVGYANGLALEGLADIPPESIGMKVDYTDNTAKKQFIMELANEYVKTKELSEDFLYLILGTDNWKYSFVLMRMAIKQRKKELQDQARQQQQDIMEQKQADLQIANAMQQAKDVGKDQNIATQGKVQMAVNKSLNQDKYQSQAALTSQKTQSKMSEAEQKAILTQQEKKNEHDLQQQEAFLADAAK